MPDHVLILGEAHLLHVLREYAHYFNRERPHQGLAQRIPQAADTGAVRGEQRNKVRTLPILGGLHHSYTRAA